MDINQITNELDWRIFLAVSIKIIGILLGLLYLFFALVMIRQIRVLKETIQIKDGGLLLSFCFIQLILTVIIVFYSLIIL